MDSDLAQKAVSSALSGNWKEAVSLNLEILKETPNDIDALNRLARAYAEIGNVKKAKILSKKVLKLDPFNKIATSSLSKWAQLKGGSTTIPNHISVDTFLEEPGKTKLVDLMHPGSPEILAKLDCGDEVILSPHAHRVNIDTLEGKYIGRLPDDLSAKIRRLMKAGCTYKALIKSVDKSEVKIFIRETFRPKEAGQLPTFLAEKIDYISFTPPELVHDKSEVSEAMYQETEA